MDTLVTETLHQFLQNDLTKETNSCALLEQLCNWPVTTLIVRNFSDHAPEI